MTAVGGPVESVSISGRNFAVAADADAEREIGGDTNEVQPNGDRTGRLIKTPKPWMMGGLALSVDDLLEDHEFLQAKANEKGFFPINFNFASGSVYGGTGQIVDEIKYSSASTTMPLAFSGPGELTPQ